MNKIIKIVLISLCVIGMILVNLNVVGAVERPFRSCWGWPTFIDPAVGSDFSSTIALLNLYDTLTLPDVKGTAQPHVAKNWTISDDGLSYTFYLHSGIKFHDGTELTAEDVKFSLERLVTIGEGYAYLFMDKVVNAEVVDNHTLVFHLDKPCGPFLGMLVRLYILNKDLVMKNIKKPGPYGNMGDYGKEWLVTHDAGSGPYTVKEYLPQESVSMGINLDYWQPFDPNVPDEIKLFNINENATVKTLLQNREVEIGHPFHSTEALESMDKIEGVDIAKFPMSGMLYYMIHTKKPPTDDIHFRKALAWALDYKTVVEDIWPGVSFARGPIPKITPGFDPTVLQYHRDLDKAKEELKKSKYYGQLDKYSIAIHWCATMPDEEKIALLFMSNCAELGIKIVSVKTPWSKMVEEAASIEESPNIMNVMVSADYAEAGSFFESRYKSDSAATWMQNEWLLDPDLDARIDEAIETIDQKERFAKYSELQQYIVDLCPSIFLFDQGAKYPYQSSYVDWPAARGEVPPVMGYAFYGPFTKIYKEKRLDLLK